MNQRIRELAEQADGVFIHKLMTGAKQYTFLEKDLEKFTQLIVQECIWAFGETRTEPSLEKYILDRLGINHGTENSGT